MKKIILIVVIAILAMITQSCDSIISTEKEQKAIAEKILECLDDENAEDLKSMFCEKALEETDNIDRQIERAMEFFEGKTESYDSDSRISYYEESSHREGKMVRLRSSGTIKDIITDQDKKYSIRFYNYLVYDEKPEKVGLSEITIYSEEGYSRVIGDFYLVNPEYK